MVDEDGTHDFLYDLRGLVQTQTVTGEGTYTYGYDAVGRNTSLAFPDGHTRIQGWDAEGRLMSRCYQYSDPSKTRCYGATYDAAGNPLTLTDPRNGHGGVRRALPREEGHALVARHPGGTASALEAEKQSGILLSKAGHGLAAQDRARLLMDLLRNYALSPADRAVAEAELEKLIDAINLQCTY